MIERLASEKEYERVTTLKYNFVLISCEKVQMYQRMFDFEQLTYQIDT